MNGMFTKDTRIFMPYIRRFLINISILIFLIILFCRNVQSLPFPFYAQTSKQFKPVAQFTFPAKKIIGNRDVNFVETRRKQLENYLRKLINYSLGAVPELGENPCKSSLFKYFPFFM